MHRLRDWLPERGPSVVKTHLIRPNGVWQGDSDELSGSDLIKGVRIKRADYVSLMFHFDKILPLHPKSQIYVQL